MKAGFGRALKAFIPLAGVVLLALPAGAAFTSQVKIAHSATCVFYSSPIANFNMVPLECQSALSPMTISGSVAVSSGVRQVILVYKKTYDVNLSSMTYSTTATAPYPASSTFSFTVSSAALGSEGFQYRVQVVNGRGTRASTPSASGFFSAGVSGYAQGLIGTSGGALVIRSPLSAQTETRVDVPSGALDGDVSMSLTEEVGIGCTLPASAQSIPAASAAVQPSGVNQGNRLSDNPVSQYVAEPEGVVFRKPVTVRLAYPPGVDPTNLKVFALTSSGWTIVGGVLDTASAEVRAVVPSLASKYALFPAAPMSAKDYRPMRKIFTPGRVDGVNDTLDFSEAMDPTDHVEIFNARGSRIKSLSWPFQWDGREESGRLVESGVYLYQYKKDGETISGVFAVAK